MLLVSLKATLNKASSNKDPFLLFIFYVCLYYTVLSAPCSLVITCWKRPDLLALLCVMFSCVFVTFPYGVSGQVWYLIVSIPDFCLLFSLSLFGYPSDLFLVAYKDVSVAYKDILTNRLFSTKSLSQRSNGTDKPVHLLSLISAIPVHCLVRILAILGVSIF